MDDKPYLPHAELKTAKRELLKQIDRFEEHLQLGEYDGTEDAKPTESSKVIII